MAIYRYALPHLGNELFACYTGMETDLIFNKNIPLPGFAAYPLLNNKQHRVLLENYYRSLILIAKQHNVGVILDSVTWVANADRATELGYSIEELAEFNKNAIKLIHSVREQENYWPTVLCGQVGPRGDGYIQDKPMSIFEARDYHRVQMAAYAETEVDFVCAFTLGNAQEAAGIVLAAKAFELPVAISFTVETDGRLPTGMSLQKAVEYVDKHTQASALYYLVNCAHPDHMLQSFNYEPWVKRVRGVVANASRCSHEELESALELDDGAPTELAEQLSQLRHSYPHFNVFGGCCGTDQRHMNAIMAATKV
ncbi:homocysteine S-methyltransferase family protein [Reinekea marina]|uniref:Homocysteine S-methyltransferase family protein n=1 Tax=Reinekea marina TaxID=1310421 RepID=A0ABV7WSB0_9GAMM|nr:homocysteine S-methyltransferase family protein [Reinekea marina]MDN3650412.1 homocysteine S-methyltransferase family protein [Reinekea marina]